MNDEKWFLWWWCLYYVMLSDRWVIEYDCYYDKNSDDDVYKDAVEW